MNDQIHIKDLLLRTIIGINEEERRAKQDVLINIVLYADTPMVSAATIRRVRRALAQGADMVVVGFRPADPAGYGRLIVEDGRLVAIREEKDAGRQERAIGLCNSGIMGFADGLLLPTLKVKSAAVGVPGGSATSITMPLMPRT